MNCTDEPLHGDHNYLGGDPVAFSAMVKRYQGALFGFVGRMGLSQLQCEDLVQETFLRAWKNREAFDASKGSLITWLFTIIKNLALNKLSRKQLFASTDDRNYSEVSDQQPGSDPAKQYEVHVSVCQLQLALQTLSAEDRAVIATLYTSIITDADACVLLDCSPGTLRTRLSRARHRLSAALRELERQ